MTHGARRFLASAPSSVLLKIDLRNAFNCVDRDAILRCVAERFPLLFPYAEAAYGHHSELALGDGYTVSSQQGVQQGDPLGPLFFSLVLMDVWEKLGRPPGTTVADPPQEPAAPLGLQSDGPRRCSGLPFAAFYLDDGAIGGSPEEVERAFAELEAAGAPVGLFVNRGKCEVVSHTPFPDRFPGVRPVSASDWTLLGAPCGTDRAAANAAVTLALDRGRYKLAGLVRMEERHPAMTLLRYCASFGLGVFYARALGRVDAFSVFDEDVRSAFAELAGLPLTGEQWLQCTLAPKHGGMGLRPLAQHAAVAYVTSASASAGLFPSLFHEDAGIAHPDTWMAEIVADPLLAPFPLALDEVQRVAKTVTTFAEKCQRTISALIEGQLASDQMARAAGDDLTTARLQALQGTYASLWVVPMNAAIGFQPCFQGNAHLDALLRYRLGIPLGETHTCPRCSQLSDGVGVHAMNCLSGGYRGHLHATMVATLMAVASTANWHPQPEPRISPTDGKRLDILFNLGGGGANAGRTKVGADFSCVNTLAASHIRAAAATPSGAANEGAREKKLKYGKLCREAGIELAPLVVDSFGGWAEEARPLLARLAKAWGARIDMWERQAVPHVMGHIAARLATLIAKTLLSSFPADLGAAQKAALAAVVPPPEPTWAAWKAAGAPPAGPPGTTSSPVVPASSGSAASS